MNLGVLFKSVLKAIGIVAILLTFAVGTLFAYSAIDKEDCFYVTGAELQDPNWLRVVESYQDVQFRERRKYATVYSHRIRAGKGTVFGYRFYSNGDVLAVDDEVYEKLTVWISDVVPSDRLEFDLSDGARVSAVYTKGGSAWPDHSCAGFVSSGTVTLERRGAEIEVHVFGAFSPIADRARGVSKYCQPWKFDKTFVASSLPVTNITTWLGKAGNHAYDETYR